MLGSTFYKKCGTDSLCYQLQHLYNAWQYKKCGTDSLCYQLHPVKCEVLRTLVTVTGDLNSKLKLLVQSKFKFNENKLKLFVKIYGDN